MAVFLLATHRHQGLTLSDSALAIFLGSGIVLLGAPKLLVGMAADKISHQLASDVTTQLKQPRDDFIHHLADALVHVNLVAGFLLVILAAIILGYLYITGRQKRLNNRPIFMKQLNLAQPLHLPRPHNQYLSLGHHIRPQLTHHNHGRLLHIVGRRLFNFASVHLNRATATLFNKLASAQYYQAAPRPDPSFAPALKRPLQSPELHQNALEHTAEAP